MEAWAASSPVGVDGVLLVQPLAAGHGTLVATLGSWEAPVQRGLLTALQSRYEVITAAEGIFSHPLDGLQAEGFQACHRQEWCNTLAATDYATGQRAEADLSPWAPGDWEEAATLVCLAHEALPSGLLLAWPAVPSRANLLTVLRRLVAEDENFLPGASFVARAGGRLVGVVWLQRTDQGPLLYELAVLPVARGGGVARKLIRAAQRALLEMGETRMWFSTSAENVDVHRLYVDAEVTRHSVQRLAVWISPRLA
ncbi:MAG: GNAT family N-acetyltransferase [Candidatus Sericytochromatia bacterium]|nr:GNAT family N-acetyltransferase [Candidatus Sericytochromatia bacterium]